MSDISFGGISTNHYYKTAVSGEKSKAKSPGEDTAPHFATAYTDSTGYFEISFPEGKEIDPEKIRILATIPGKMPPTVEVKTEQNKSVGKNKREHLPKITAIPYDTAGSSLSENNDITFTFDSPDNPWSEEELSELKSWVEQYYPRFKKLFGKVPPLQINVRKSRERPYYNPTGFNQGEILLAGPSPSVLAHETVHGLFIAGQSGIFGRSSFEEGIAEAAATIVVNRGTSNYWKEYEVINRLSLSEDETFGFSKYTFWGNVQYDMAAGAWMKIYQENKGLFKSLYEKVYAKFMQEGQIEDDGDLIKLCSGIQPVVEGENFAEWYFKQNIFNARAKDGYYITSYSGYNNILQREGWKVSPRQDLLGLIQRDFYDLPGNFLGHDKNVNCRDVRRAKAYARIESAYISDEAFVFAPGKETGLYGVVEGGQKGFLVVKDRTGKELKATRVTEGYFSLPEFESTLNPLHLIFYNEEGTKTVEKKINKISPHYFALLGGEKQDNYKVIEYNAEGRLVSGRLIDKDGKVVEGGRIFVTDQEKSDELDKEPAWKNFNATFSTVKVEKERSRKKNCVISGIIPQNKIGKAIAEIRDKYLLSSYTVKIIAETYYEISPYLASSETRK